MGRGSISDAEPPRLRTPGDRPRRGTRLQFATTLLFALALHAPLSPLSDVTRNVNSANALTSRTVPGYVSVVGRALSDASVSVNGAAAARQGQYFHKEVAADNSGTAAWQSTQVEASREGTTDSVSGHVFVPRTPEGFTYDLDGNVTSDGRWSYAWDAENRLVQMESSAESVAAGAPRLRVKFGYDYRSRRVSKRVEEWVSAGYRERTRLTYIYDGWNLAAEMVSATRLLRSYAWGADLSGGTAAAGIGGLLYIRQAPEEKTFSVAYDGSGNVAALTDMADGSNAATYEYGPFGEPVRVSGAFGAINPIRWSTKMSDPETQLSYYGYRFYDPTLGRWQSRDPIGEEGGMNLYGFVGNNPIWVVDPLGLDWYSEGAGGMNRAVGDFLSDVAWNLNTGSAGTDFFARTVLGTMAEANYQVAERLTPQSYVEAVKRGQERTLQFTTRQTDGSVGAVATVGILFAMGEFSGANMVLEGVMRVDMATGEKLGPMDAATRFFGGLSQITAVGAIAARGPKPCVSTQFVDVEFAARGADNLVTVRTYTGAAGREGITSSGALRADTWVTLPGEIPSRAGHLQIEKLLEIQPGRGANFVEFQVPSSNLRIPANGPTTSGGALQFQLNNPVPIDPSTFRLPPGRPAR